MNLVIKDQHSKDKFLIAMTAFQDTLQPASFSVSYKNNEIGTTDQHSGKVCLDYDTTDFTSENFGISLSMLSN